MKKLYVLESRDQQRLSYQSLQHTFEKARSSTVESKEALENSYDYQILVHFYYEPRTLKILRDLSMQQKSEEEDSVQNLESTAAMYKEIENFEGHYFQIFKNTIFLNLSLNKIDNIEPLSQIELPSLTDLIMAINEFASLKALAKARFPRLKQISFSEGKVEFLRGLERSNSQHLEKIFGYDNRIINVETLLKLETNSLKDVLLENEENPFTGNYKIMWSCTEKYRSPTNTNQNQVTEFVQNLNEASDSD